MIYSKLYFKHSNLVLLFLLTGFSLVLLIATFFRQSQLSSVKATKKNLAFYEIVNVSPSQIGVFWQTESSEEGWLQLPTGQKIYDERDMEGSLQKYSYHYVLLKNLKENTDYRFFVFNNEGMYKNGGKGAYQIKTPKKLPGGVSARPAYGKVIEPSGKFGKGTFVELKIKNTYPLLVLTKDTGEWLISLSSLFDIATGKGISAPEGSWPVQVIYYDEKKRNSQVKSILSYITPMAQTVILGSDYNLLAKGDVLSASTQQNIEQKLPISVMYPRENALIPAGKPLIKGLGIPNNDVFIFINSHPQFTYRTKIDKKGEWRVLPTQSIGPGSYIATITSQDGKGGTITIKRNFMIAKSGEQVLGLATGEATITPIQPYATPTITIVSSSPTPRAVLPTTMATPTIYITPYPSVAAPTNAPPTTGTSINYLVLASIAFITVGIGFMLVF